MCGGLKGIHATTDYVMCYCLTSSGGGWNSVTQVRPAGTIEAGPLGPTGPVKDVDASRGWISAELWTELNWDRDGVHVCVF